MASSRSTISHRHPLHHPHPLRAILHNIYRQCHECDVISFWCRRGRWMDHLRRAFVFFGMEVISAALGLHSSSLTKRRENSQIRKLELHWHSLGWIIFCRSARILVPEYTPVRFQQRHNFLVAFLLFGSETSRATRINNGPFRLERFKLKFAAAISHAGEHFELPTSWCLPIDVILINIQQ